MTTRGSASPRKLGASGFLNVALTAATTVLALAASYRLLVPSDSEDRQPSWVEEAAWSRVQNLATPLSGSDGDFDIVVAFDFECPACRQMLLTDIPQLESRYGAELRIGLLHYPLPNHPRARQMAIASECAATVGRFRAFSDQLAVAARSPFDSLARAAGIADVAAFTECTVADDLPGRRVALASSLADSLRLPFTPTTFVRGARLMRPAGIDDIEASLRHRRRP